MRPARTVAIWGLFVPMGIMPGMNPPMIVPSNFFTSYPSPAPATPRTEPEGASVPALYANGQFVGTGTLFLDPKIVLTVAHVTYDSDGNAVKRMQALFACQDGKPLRADGTVITKGKGKEAGGLLTHSGDDWALVVLDQAVSNSCAKPFDAFTQSAQALSRDGRVLSLLGYSDNINDGSLSISEGCNVIAYDPKYPRHLLHCCGASTGASGGPIFLQAHGWYQIAAI